MSVANQLDCGLVSVVQLSVPYMHNFLRALTVITVVVGSTYTAQAQERLRIEIDVRADVSRDQAVMLWYSIRNDSVASQTVELGYDRIGNFRFWLQGPNGLIQKTTPVVRPRDHGARSRALTLAPGESYRQHIVLNEWLRFDQVGAYSLRVELAGEAATRLTVIGDAVRQVQVGPDNPGQIEDRCKALLAVLVPMTRYDADFDAAVAELTWMRHPAAVRYLEQALAAEVNPDLFDALVAIATAEARNAVTRLARHRTPWVANGAKNALARMK